MSTLLFWLPYLVKFTTCWQRYWVLRVIIIIIIIIISASVELTQTRHSHLTFPLVRPPGAANPQKGRRHIRNQSTPACKIWRESARGLTRNRWQKSEQKTYSKTNTSPFALTSELPFGTQPGLVRRPTSSLNFMLNNAYLPCC